MLLIEFIDTFQEFLIKLLKAFLSTSIVYLSQLFCARGEDGECKNCMDKMRFNAYRERGEQAKSKIIAGRVAVAGDQPKI